LRRRRRRRRKRMKKNEEEEERIIKNFFIQTREKRDFNEKGFGEKSPLSGIGT
jgi:hypothetical protein